MQCIRHLLADGSSLLYSWFEAMHTRMDMILWDHEADEAAMQSLASSICEEVRRIERMGSCFLPDSEVAMVNGAPAGTAVTVSDELYEILSVCLDCSVETDGFFDISAAPGVILPLHDKIKLGPDCSVMRVGTEVRINLSGFLKGYALDKAVRLVNKASVHNALLNFGNSSIFAIGNHPSGCGWPVADNQGNEYVLHDECLTTSGNNSQERRHIINPLTGNFIAGQGAVSVVTRTATDGEVASTVAFIRKNTSELNSGL